MSKTPKPDPARFDAQNGPHWDGKPRNGAIRPTYEVHCAGCEDFHGGLHPTMPKAANELHHMGWTKIKGLWRCRTCSEKIA